MNEGLEKVCRPRQRAAGWRRWRVCLQREGAALCSGASVRIRWHGVRLPKYRHLSPLGGYNTVCFEIVVLVFTLRGLVSEGIGCGCGWVGESGMGCLCTVVGEWAGGGRGGGDGGRSGRGCRGKEEGRGKACAGMARSTASRAVNNCQHSQDRNRAHRTRPSSFIFWLCSWCGLAPHRLDTSVHSVMSVRDVSV